MFAPNRFVDWILGRQQGEHHSPDPSRGRTIRWLGANNPTPGLRKTRGLAGASGAAERASSRARARARRAACDPSLDDGMVWWLWGEAELGVG